jgi:hypothetical protein
MRRILATLVLLGTLPLPVPALAVGSITANASFAGVGTEIVLSGFAPNSNLDLTFTSPSHAEFVLPVTVNPAGYASEMVPGDALQEAGTYTVTAHGIQAKLQTTLDIAPASIDADMSDIEARMIGAREAEVTVTLRDRFANPLPNRPALLISSRSTDRIQAVTNQTDANGIQRFVLQTVQPGVIALSSLDLLSSTILAGRATLNMGGSIGGNTHALTASIFPTASAQDVAVKGFKITAPKTVPRGEPFSFQVTAVDAAGSIVQSYESSVYISTPSDPDANLPGSINSDREGFGQLRFFIQGQGRMDVSLATWFETEGEQELVIEDAADSSIRGSAMITVTPSDGPNDTKTIRILSPKGTVASTSTIVTGIASAYSNLIITGGNETVMTETDGEGNYSAQVRIPTGATQVTLTVSDESGRLKSASVTLKVDASAPSGGNASLSPSSVPAESNVLATLQLDANEADIKSITLEISGQSLPMSQNPVNPTLYQTNFAAPPDIGKYTATFRVQDDAGNTAITVRELTVTEKGLSRIENIRATGEAGSVRITWNPSKDEIDGYAILIASPESVGPNSEPIFDRSLNVPPTAASAIVEGLNAGWPYVFAVVAKRAGNEGPQSAAVVATPTGLSVRAVPGRAEVQLSWEFKDAPPLLGYFIEYGLSPTTLSEKRQVSTVQTVRIGDLLPREYFFRVTPIDVTAKRMEKLAVLLKATPLDQGFHGAAGDPVSIDPNLPTPPSNTNSGIPPLAWWAALALTVLAYAVHRKNKKKTKQTKDFLCMMERQYHRSSHVS